MNLETALDNSKVKTGGCGMGLDRSEVKTRGFKKSDNGGMGLDK